MFVNVNAVRGFEGLQGAKGATKAIRAAGVILGSISEKILFFPVKLCAVCLFFVESSYFCIKIETKQCCCN